MCFTINNSQSKFITFNFLFQWLNIYYFKYLWKCEMNLKHAFISAVHICGNNRIFLLDSCTLSKQVIHVMF